MPIQENLVSAGLITMAELIEQPPQISLNIYPFGVLVRKYTPDDGFSEFAVDPNQIVEALALQVGFNTGLLGGDILFVKEQGTERVIASYRKPAHTPILVEGTAKPFDIPLPGLVMVREVSGGQVAHQVFAVKQKPTAMTTRFWAAPLPNVTPSTGNICFGSVPKPSKQSLASSNLSEDWDLFLKTPFNGHTVFGKSHRFERDIRQMYTWLEREKPRRYPTVDLVATGVTLGSILEGRS